jgi:hypothetical protein
VADGRRDKGPKAVTGAQGTIKTRNKGHRTGRKEGRKEVSKRNRISIKKGKSRSFRVGAKVLTTSNV